MAGALAMLAPFIWMVLDRVKAANRNLLLRSSSDPLPLRAVRTISGPPSPRPICGAILLNGADRYDLDLPAFRCWSTLPAAYALAKLRFLGRDALFATGAVLPPDPAAGDRDPDHILLLHKLGVLDTYAALVLPFTISVFGIFLMRQFFLAVPDDLIDAARIDGMCEFGIVWRVMLPTAIPALVAFGIFSVVAHWNDYFWPLIVRRQRGAAHAAARRRASSSATTRPAPTTGR